MAERDYPVGHPAASDYAGQKYTPPRAPFSEDFAPDHPARGGKNISPLDTPDGMRAAVVEVDKANAERTAHMESDEATPVVQEPFDGTNDAQKRWIALRQKHQP